jgi:DNA-directed RNA polymerase subunit RPC12/RpoP
MGKIIIKRCPVCKKEVVFEYIGATIGAGQLYACPDCDVVIIVREG